MGEHRHLILQALCRGAVRKSDGHQCQPMDAYVICSVRSGIKDALPDIFPGCKIVDWKPIPDDLQGTVKAAFDFVTGWFEFAEPGERLPFRKVAEQLRVTPKAFKDQIRRSEAFREAISARDIVEHGDGRYMTCYRLASDLT